MVTWGGVRAPGFGVRGAVAAAIALGACVSLAEAQRAPRLFVDESTESTAGRRLDPRPLAVAKWTTLGVSAVLAGLGYAASAEADDRFRALEERCGRDACERDPDGRYVDPRAERLRVEGEEADRRAKALLLAGQVGIVASVALFILDLSNGGPPPNLPYEPPGFRLGAAAGGGVRVEGRLRW